MIGNWHSLFMRAVGHMRNLGLDHRSFVWGGGTILALRHQHRTSQDIDLFLSDPQLLSYLSPRLNDQTARDVRDYSETAHTLRLEYPEGDIDFLVVAPVFPALSEEEMEIAEVGMVRTMPDKEILGQKLHYRAFGFTGRDLYDFMALTTLNPGLMRDPDLISIARNRGDALRRALAAPACLEGYRKVAFPRFATSFDEARARMLLWLDDSGQTDSLAASTPPR